MKRWEYSDGGRREAGFRGDTGDCFVRALAISAQLPYRDVYLSVRATMKVNGEGSPRGGISTKLSRQIMADMGWEWVPTMAVGQGCTVHLNPLELPVGRIVARVSRHFVAVINGVAHDTYDPTRAGTRCVYGYWQKGVQNG